MQTWFGQSGIPGASLPDDNRWGEQEEKIWTNYATWIREWLLPRMIDVEKPSPIIIYLSR